MDTLINCFVPKGIERKRNATLRRSATLISLARSPSSTETSSPAKRCVASPTRQVRPTRLSSEEQLHTHGISRFGAYGTDCRHYRCRHGVRRPLPSKCRRQAQGTLPSSTTNRVVWRDDFNFGSVVLFRTDALKDAAKRMTADYRAAGFYDLRLKTL